MSAHPPTPDPARSFGRVAGAYDRARPSYPREAVAWLAGSTPGQVLELGAGTGKLTEVLADLGHRVLATDPSAEMVAVLAQRAPQARAAQATAEQPPVRARGVDTVVCAQSFHWFDHDRMLVQAARVLRPGGVLGVVWNARDERIPWVRRLGEIIGDSADQRDPTPAIDRSGLFEPVKRSTFRFWQPMTRELLRDLVTSRSNLAVLEPRQRERVLERVDALYEEYGRGADGMLLPYLTHGFRATVRPQPDPGPAAGATDPDELDTDALLIDFR